MSRYSMRVLFAFEAVGRHLSFSKAADDLNISQSAISRNIAALEAGLNCRLVSRTTRSCALTPAGEQMHAGISEGLQCIQSAIQSAERATADNQLNISISPFLSVAWFTPRLLDFIALNPDIDVNLLHSYEPPAFNSDNVDIGINWGRKPIGMRLAFELAIPGDLIPVCTPEYAVHNIGTTDVTSLRNCTLYHEFTDDDWQAWFCVYGLYDVQFNAQRISDTGALRQAALSGKGAALLFRALIDEDLRSGKLVCPFEKSVNTGHDYWITYPVEHAGRPAIKRLLKWFRKQVAQQSTGALKVI